jgi:DNA-binding GntR family transcriptional regulator
MEFMRHYTNRGDLRKMKQINEDYHGAIHEAAKSRLLLASVRRIIAYLKLSVHTKDYRREHLDSILTEHERIYGAIKRLDPDQAADEMASHMDNMARRTLKK